MIYKELYTPKAVAANGTYTHAAGEGIGGFFCTTAGTLTITADSVLLPAIVVSASVYYPLPMAAVSISAVCSGGAAGIILAAL